MGNLCLTRRPEEAVVIAPGTPYETRVVVVRIDRDQVRLAFKADPSVAVVREELLIPPPPALDE